MQGRTTIDDPGTANALLCDASGHLQVDIVSGGGGGGGGTQFAGEAVLATTGTGTVLIGRDGGAGLARIAAMDAAGHLQVDVLSGAIGDVSAAITNTVDISNAVLQKTGVGTSADVLRVTLATDSSGVMQMQGRTTIGDPGTANALLCDTSVHLQVNILATNIGSANNLANNVTLSASGGTSNIVDTTNMNIMNILYEDTNVGNLMSSRLCKFR